MLNILPNILPIFILIILGKIARNIWLNSEQLWDGIDKLCYFVFFPSALFLYSIKNQINFFSILKLVLLLIFIASLVIISSIIVCFKYKSINRSQFSSLIRGSFTHNSYIFIGLGGAIYSNNTVALSIIASISTYMMILNNILSVIILISYSETRKAHNPFIGHGRYWIQKLSVNIIKILGNPLVLSSLMGLTLNYYQFFPDIYIERTLKILGDAAFPIGCINIGAHINISLNQDNLKPVFVASFLKLLLFPMISIVMLYLIDIPEPGRSIVILYSALPCSSSAYILSKRFGGDCKLMSSIITFSTILCVVSLPLFSVFMNFA